MENFCFVILHYKLYNDTVECVESILENISYKNYNIIIVDNGSGNHSGEKLKEKYAANPEIIVILNPDNLGFAKGNNLGFHYAKYNLKSSFIVLMNNDIIIRQADFIESIIERYNSMPYHILGPDIISLVDDRHQNPSPVTLQNRIVLEKLINHYKILLFLNYFLVDKLIEKVKKKIIKQPFINQEIQTVKNKENKELLNVKLHGSCLVFSPDYIKVYDGLYPKTFMYSEEAILYFIAKRDGLITVYFPETKIYHKEDLSTDYVFKRNYKKRRFYYKNFINSGKILLELMKNSKTKNIEMSPEQRN